MVFKNIYINFFHEWIYIHIYIYIYIYIYLVLLRFMVLIGSFSELMEDQILQYN